MSTGRKQKPNSSRSATALLVAHRSVILAGRRKLQQTSDWNHRFDRVEDQNAQISRMSPFVIPFCDSSKVGSRAFNRAGPFAAARSEKQTPRRRHVSASSDSQISSGPLTILMLATSVPNSIGIAVGTAVTSRPPHRSVRDGLCHTAPPSGQTIAKIPLPVVIQWPASLLG